VTTCVRNTEVTAFILRACRAGLRAVQVVAELEKRWPQAAPGSAHRVLRELIECGFLLHDLLPDDPRRDPLGHLAGRLPAVSPHRQVLERLRGLLDEADRHPAGSPLRLALLTDASALAQEIVPADRFLRVDTVMDATVTLPLQIADRAAEAADVLWRIGWGTDPLTGYHQRFLSCYGTSRAVPLLDVLDPVTGLGPVEDQVAPIGAGDRDARRAAVLAGLLSDALARGVTEVVVDEATIGRLANRDEAAVPRTAEIYVRVLAPDSTSSADGRFLLAVCGGSQDALSTSGRFAPLLDRPPHIHEAEDGAIVAELVVRPRLDAFASVAAETGLAGSRPGGTRPWTPTPPSFPPARATASPPT
jgi:lantibiotic biosynthesis protein